MNTGFYKDLDTNFQIACELSEKEFLHAELIEMLKNGNIPEKQIAALKLERVVTEEEAKALVTNLTGCDGKIREAVALKISNLLNENQFIKDLFIYPEIFADATIDINGNICKLVLDSVKILKSEKFTPKYLEKIMYFIEEAYRELDNFIFRDKKYVINKQLFKLYWCLEALKLFVKELDKNKLLLILERAYVEKEYTIREKVAEILLLVEGEMFEELKFKLKADENYYVRQKFEKSL